MILKYERHSHYNSICSDCVAASFNNMNKKESEMSDRAVPRITSVVPESEDKTSRRDASPFPVEDQIESLVRSRDSEYGKYDRMAQLTVALNDIFYAHMQQYNSNKRLY